MGGGHCIDQKVVIYKQSVALEVRLNNKAVGLTKFGKTGRMFGLLCAVLKVISYRL
jgi:hypothetical protein